MSTHHPDRRPRMDGLPDPATHLAVIAQSGIDVDSPSFANAQITLTRCSTYGSAKVYAGVLRRFFAFMSSRPRPPVEANSDDIDVFLASLRGIAGTTQGCYWGVLTSYFKRAVERDLIVRSPFLGRRRPSEVAETPTPALTKSEAQALLDGVATDFGHPDRDLTARRDYALVSTMLFLCIRSTEVTRARWDGIQRDRGELRLSFVGKGGKPAQPHLPDKLHHVLLAWKMAYEAATGTVLLPSDPLFVAVGGTEFVQARGRKQNRPLPPLTTRTVANIVARHIERLDLNLIGGMPGKRFAAHCMRATGATLLLEEGADVLDIQSVLRHAQIETTLAYMRRLENRSKRAIERNPLQLSEAMFALPGAEVKR